MGAQKKHRTGFGSGDIYAPYGLSLAFYYFTRPKSCHLYYTFTK